jgi:hypothetical protein
MTTEDAQRPVSGAPSYLHISSSFSLFNSASSSWVKSLPASTLAMQEGERIQKFSRTLAGDVPVAAQRVPPVVVTIKSVVSFVSFIVLIV